MEAMNRRCSRDRAMAMASWKGMDGPKHMNARPHGGESSYINDKVGV